jgi:adenylate cyclase
LERICAKLSVRTASIMLVREDKGDLVIHAYRGMDDALARKVRLMIGEAIAGYVAEKGEPLLIEDIDKDPRFVPFHRERYRSGTLLSVPILHEKSVFGVINLSDPVREGPFEDRDLEVLQALSRQAALAIVNHRLYQEFENGQWIKEYYEEGLAQKLSEKVFKESQVLDEIEGKYRASILSVRLHENDISRTDGDVKERIRRIEETLQSVREIVVRYQGSVAGDTGSGLVGIFGLPFPDEKAPWRAVLAAVNLLKTFVRLAQDSSSNKSGFGISVGVASGELLFREKKGGAPFAVFGEAWERAVTLMQAGSPGQILVDEETFDRISSGVNGLRLTLPYGIHKQLTVYGIKGLKRKNAAG